MSFNIHLDGCYICNSSSGVKALDGNELHHTAAVKAGDLVHLRFQGELRLFSVLDPGKNTRDLYLSAKLPKVYLAGPMRGYPLHNFPAFLTAAAHLESLGFEVVNPAQHDLDCGFLMSKPIDEQKFSVEKALGWDFVQVIECAGIVLLDGWDASTGAKAERLVAEMTGKLVLRLNSKLELFSDAGEKWISALSWTTLRKPVLPGTPEAGAPQRARA